MYIDPTGKSFLLCEQLDSKHGMFIPTLIFSDVNEGLRYGFAYPI